MNRPSIQQQVTFLYTRDLETSSRFYEDHLGLGLALDQGSCRIYHVCPGSFIGLCQRDDTPQEPQGIILTLVTTEVDEWHHYLAGQNITVDKPPTLNTSYNIYHFFVRDPNGYLIEIQQFLDPRWPH